MTDTIKRYNPQEILCDGSPGRKLGDGGDEHWVVESLISKPT